MFKLELELELDFDTNLRKITFFRHTELNPLDGGKRMEGGKGEDRIRIEGGKGEERTRSNKNSPSTSPPPVAGQSFNSTLFRKGVTTKGRSPKNTYILSGHVR